MDKHTQTIRRNLSTNCMSVFDHFVGLALKGLTIFSEIILFYVTEVIFLIPKILGLQNVADIFFPY